MYKNATFTVVTFDQTEKIQPALEHYLSASYILYHSFEPDPFPMSKILITPTGSADSKNSIDGNRNKNETLNKVCIPV